MAKILFVTVFLGLVSLGYSGQLFPIRDFEMCNATANPSLGALSHLDVPACNSFPCTLIKGQSYQVDIIFRPHNADSQLVADVKGIIAGLELPWPGGVDADACKFLVGSGGRCPYNPGMTLTYSVNLEILNEYPEVRVVAKWMLNDAAKRHHFCILLPLDIRRTKNGDEVVISGGKISPIH